MSASLLDTNEFLSITGFPNISEYRDLVGKSKFHLSKINGYDVGTPTTVEDLLNSRLSPSPDLHRFEELKGKGVLLYLTDGPLLLDDDHGNHLLGEFVRFRTRMLGRVGPLRVNSALLSTYCAAHRLGLEVRESLAESLRACKMEFHDSERDLVDYDSLRA